MIEVLSSLLSAGSGGLFGGIMAIGTSIMKARERKADHERRMEMLRFELERDEVQHDRTLETTRQQASKLGLLASIKADRVDNLPSWAASIKALFRPLLTASLVTISAYIFTLLLDALDGSSNVMGDNFSPDELVAMLRYTVNSLIFSTTTSVTWWFGERALTTPQSK